MQRESLPLEQVNNRHLFSVICCDLGSTNFKIGQLSLLETCKAVKGDAVNELSVEYEEVKPWMDWRPQLLETKSQRLGSEGEVYRIKILDEEGLRQLADYARDQIETIRSKNVGVETAVAFTGLHHSLVVTCPKNENGDSKTVVLLDDPSLTTVITPDQNKVFESIIGRDSQLKSVSTLMKILALKNDPGLIQELFGEGVEFKDLIFTNIVGYLQKQIMGSENLASLPRESGERIGFNQPILIETARQILIQLGLGEEQIILGEEYVDEHGWLYGIDFSVEIALLEKILQSRNNELNIDKLNTVVIECDTVGKAVSESGLPKKYDKDKDITYLVQRLFGRINPTWMRKMFINECDGQMANLYPYVDKLLQRRLYEGANNWQQRYMFLPDYGDMGGLFTVDADSWKEVNFDDASELKHEDKEEVAMAMAVGLMLGIRNKIDETGLNYQQVLLCGGLVHENSDQSDPQQWGWRKIFSLCFAPETRVYKIHGMSSGAEAVGKFCLEHLGYDVGLVGVDYSYLGVGGAYEDYYQLWTQLNNEKLQLLNNKKEGGSVTERKGVTGEHPKLDVDSIDQNEVLKTVNEDKTKIQTNFAPNVKLVDHVSEDCPETHLLDLAFNDLLRLSKQEDGAVAVSVADLNRLMGLQQMLLGHENGIRGED